MKKGQDTMQPTDEQIEDLIDRMGFRRTLESTAAKKGMTAVAYYRLIIETGERLRAEAQAAPQAAA